MKRSSPLLLIDAGMGNLASVANIIRKVGGEVKVSSSPAEILQAQKLVLPGVGSFNVGMSSLKDRSLNLALKVAVRENGSMLLGICLGMQLLFESSEEGNQPGLGLIKGHVRRFQLTNKGLRIPHMGWNFVKPNRPSNLFSLEDEQRFYFVHSYFVECANLEDVSATTRYGNEFASATECRNVMGVQFHPEKSHRFGMALFKRYLDLTSC